MERKSTCKKMKFIIFVIIISLILISFIEVKGKPLPDDTENIKYSMVTICDFAHTYFKNLNDSNKSYTKMKEYTEILILCDQELDQEVLNKIGGFTKLQHLFLRGSDLKYFGADVKFPDMPNLKTLHIFNFPNLEYIGNGSFSGLTGLTELMISNNIKLKEISVGAFAKVYMDITYYPALKTVDISNNNLMRFPSDLTENWKITAYANIGGNPWNCSDPENYVIFQKILPHLKSKGFPLNETYCIDKGQKILIEIYDDNLKQQTKIVTLTTPTIITKKKTTTEQIFTIEQQKQIDDTTLYKFSSTKQQNIKSRNPTTTTATDLIEKSIVTTFSTSTEHVLSYTQPIVNTIKVKKNQENYIEDYVINSILIIIAVALLVLGAGYIICKYIYRKSCSKQFRKESNTGVSPLLNEQVDETHLFEGNSSNQQI